jgi:hypothetical protein
MMAFSKLAQLGDLRQYSLKEMQMELKNWRYSFSKSNENLTAIWSNRTTMISILYDKEGKFVKILEERWICYFLKDKVFLRK